MPSEFSLTRPVEFHETDMAGIMHFANFFRWMEVCETAFYRSLGLPLISFVPGQVVGWPRVNVWPLAELWAVRPSILAEQT